MQKRTMITRLIVAGLLQNMLLNNAFAEDWSSIIKKQDYEIWVDIDSYNVANGYPYILTKTIFKKNQLVLLQGEHLKKSEHLKNQNLDNQKNNSKKENTKKIQFLTTIKNQQFNCKSPQFRTQITHFYNAKNQLTGTDKTTKAFEAIQPNTDEFSVGQLVCQVHQMLGGQ